MLGGMPKLKKNDQVKFKTKWKYPTKTIKRGKLKKHDKCKERHYSTFPKFLEPWNTF